MNTVSNTSSLPLSPVKVTLGAVLVEPAPLEVPRGVVWSTPAKFGAGNDAIGYGARESDRHCSRTPLGGLIRL